MTNKEAIEILREERSINAEIFGLRFFEALEIAIKALEERSRGEWEIDSDGLPVCKECGEIALQRIFVKMPHLIIKKIGGDLFFGKICTLTVI